MVKLSKKVTVNVEAKVMRICVKARDSGCYSLLDQAGGEIHFVDGYVPGWFPGGGGDYIEFDIDIETGQILNWKVPGTAQIEEWIDEDS